MKKLLAILLALMMVLVSVAALAADGDDPKVEATEPDIAAGINNPGASEEATFTLTKNYALTGETAVNPADVIKFTVADADFDNAGTVKPSPIPMISIVYPNGAQGYAVSQGDTSAEITVKLPKYTVPGIYTYTISEVDTNVAGVTYLANPLNVKITIAYNEDETKLVVAGIAVREGKNTTKTDSFENKYEAGTLTVSKTVNGNMGDKNKEWNFTVVFTAPEGDTVMGDITTSATGATAPAKILAGTGWSGTTTKTSTFKLVSGQSVTFSNIPKGVTYTVAETEAGANGYKTTVGSTELKSGTDTISGSIAGSEDDTVAVVNTKNVDIDTGVTLDSTVYMLIMALALAGIVVLKIRRREDY